MNASIKEPQVPQSASDAPKTQRLDLAELRANIARGDYEVRATVIAERMLTARVFHNKKHG